MRRKYKLIIYFTVWICIAILAAILNFLNIDFTRTNYVTGIFLMVTLGIIQGSVMEFPVQTVACLIIGKGNREIPKAKYFSKTLILNYNLMAATREEVDECMRIMFDAFIGNLSFKISAVLISATNNEKLRDYELSRRDFYRHIIFNELYCEGLAFAYGDYDLIQQSRLEHIWSKYENVEPFEFILNYLGGICKHFVKEFMVIHRVTRVLRKCGQYQDLMLLSDGHTHAYTYCDKTLYGNCSRKFGENLFYESKDVKNILNRKFDYTLVLDSDTEVPQGTAYELMKIAEKHPDKGIIQPAIYMKCVKDDTLFMNLEFIRQTICEPLTNAKAAIFEQCSYFGKALIKNEIYITEVIGTLDNIKESVPIDLLSHDTYEAVLLKPMYVGSVFLYETPCFNYITWNIRERRWNRGEILLAMYFWKRLFGVPMRFLQRIVMGRKFVRTKVRTESSMDIITCHIAHESLRQMALKPLLLFYILIHLFVDLKYQYLPVVIIMCLILVFPKISICSRQNLKYILIEIMTSVLQFTPEAVTGCVRISKAFLATIRGFSEWIPQRTVEEEFMNNNVFLLSFKHLWGYSLVGTIGTILILYFRTPGIFVVVMLGTLIILPVYTGISSLRMRNRHCTRTDVSTISSIRNDFPSSDIPGSQRSSIDSINFMPAPTFSSAYQPPDSSYPQYAFL